MRSIPSSTKVYFIKVFFLSWDLQSVHPADAGCIIILDITKIATEDFHASKIYIHGGAKK